MGFFDNLKEKATDLAQSGVAKSKQLAEIAKLKTSNMGEEDAIKKAYVEIGKLYYAEKGQAPDSAYIAACEKITAAKAAIEVNTDRIAQLKAELKESGTEVVEDLAEEVSEAAEAVEEAVEETVEAVGEAAEEAAETIEEAVDETVETAEETAEDTNEKNSEF